MTCAIPTDGCAGQFESERLTAVGLPPDSNISRRNQPAASLEDRCRAATVQLATFLASAEPAPPPPGMPGIGPAPPVTAAAFMTCFTHCSKGFSMPLATIHASPVAARLA